jgi:hypothetical protein
MQIRRWVLTPLAFALLASASVSFVPALAQQKKDPKLDKLQQQELQTAFKLADDLASGQPVPSDIGMSIRTDFLKALDGLTVVPFVLSLDPAQVRARSVILYFRLVARPPLPPTRRKTPARGRTGRRIRPPPSRRRLPSRAFISSTSRLRPPENRTGSRGPSRFPPESTTSIWW